MSFCSRSSLLLLLASSLFAAGSVSQSCEPIGNSGFWAVAFSWTGDSITGSVPVTRVANCPKLQGFVFLTVESAPGTPAPTNGYSLKVLDSSGVDVLGGLATASSTAAQLWGISTSAPPVNGLFSLSITGNSVASAQGRIMVYLAPVAPVTTGMGLVTSVFGRPGVVIAQVGDYTIAQVTNGVGNNQSNTYTTGDQDFGAATTLKLPTASALAPTANGLIAYDTMNNLYHFGRNGLSLIVGLLEGSFADNDCVKYKASTGGIQSAGAPCGSGSGNVTWKTNGSTTIAGSTANLINLDGILFTAASNPAGTYELQIGVDRAKTPTKISSGSQALGTSAIASTACATVVTAAAIGAASTDNILITPNASLKAVTGYSAVTTGGLMVTWYPTANAINIDVCNPTSSSITPGAVTLNWMVLR